MFLIDKEYDYVLFLERIYLLYYEKWFVYWLEFSLGGRVIMILCDQRFIVGSEYYINVGELGIKRYEKGVLYGNLRR